MKPLFNLMIVDDEPYMIENVKNTFPWSDLGYSICSVCYNGEEALNYLNQNHVDVILTDIQMPVVDGITLIKKIREQNIPVEVVFLSAYSDFEYAQKGILYGAIDYLVKPIVYQEFIDLFKKIYHRILNSHQVTTQNLSSEDQVIIKISEYINKYPDKSTIESCASSIGLSTEYISKLLKNHMSMSFSEYVYQRKMIRAGELLHNIALQISTISELLGYTNPKNFSRAFQRYYNISPMEFRKLKSNKK